ncbi:MAG: choloylglycine hydrolase [Clostridia bacterium]|nr:choloylglycine hydrolase [Clostridia bacterium]
MCTAIGLKTHDFYFGRTLDNEFSFGEEITVTPRNFPFRFRFTGEMKSHYAIIGMAYNKDGFPLYFDAINEKGLCIAGLNFVGNAYYKNCTHEALNIAQFEFIPYILGRCATVSEAEIELKKINITNTPFSAELPVAQLHWLIADKENCITLEVTKKGTNIYDNPVGVLTNNPTFPEQIGRLNDYMHLSNKPPNNTFAPSLELEVYSKGMGGMGLPGDLSSQSRFVRAAFTRCNSVCENHEISSVSQFFKVLGTVEQTRGVNKTEDGYEITIYTSCCNAQKGIYYYKTYDGFSIKSVDMNKENLDGCELIKYPVK